MAEGVTVFWANMVLFPGHPLEAVLGRVAVVGQEPASLQRWDDKSETDRSLRSAGLPVARSSRVRKSEPVPKLPAFPAGVKPARGRGSQGVRLVADAAALRRKLDALSAEGVFGDTAMVEEALPGTELTITVMPPASPGPDGASRDDWWALPPCDASATTARACL